MDDYDMLPLDADYSKAELIEMYNDAVETIWLLEQYLHDAHEDYDLLAQSYEEVSNLLYG